ncbi:hypothetical protein PybrP1_004607, partial [[Pythium] brassicae (nom. inval.)]
MNNNTAVVAAKLEFDGTIPPNLSPEELAMIQTKIVEYFQTKLEHLSVVVMVMYSTLCAFCFALIVYLRRNKSGAHKGDSGAARKALLPAFEPLLWILAFVLLLVVVFMLQKSVTIPALIRAVAITLVLSTYTLPIAWYMQRYNDISDMNLNFWQAIEIASYAAFRDWKVELGFAMAYTEL